MIALWLIILLAVIQGIFEWIPVSSKGWLFLILTWTNQSENALDVALFFHIGTMLAVIVRFWRDFKLLFNFKVWLEGRRIKKKSESEIIEKSNEEKGTKQLEQDNQKYPTETYLNQKILWKFILLATFATAIIGAPLYFLLKYVLQDGKLLEFAGGKMSTSDIITLIVGLFLVGTGIFILASRKKTSKKSLFEMNTLEILIVGFIQGIAIIPGVSRSGTTVGTMLIEGVEEKDALRASYLLSVPAVLGANILTILVDIIQGETLLIDIPWYGMILAIFISGIIGYLTIDFFLWLAKKVNFGWFCIIFGGLAIIITIVLIITSFTT